MVLDQVSNERMGVFSSFWSRARMRTWFSYFDFLFQGVVHKRILQYTWLMKTSNQSSATFLNQVSSNRGGQIHLFYIPHWYEFFRVASSWRNLRNLHFYWWSDSFFFLLETAFVCGDTSCLINLNLAFGFYDFFTSTYKTQHTEERSEGHSGSRSKLIWRYFLITCPFHWMLTICSVIIWNKKHKDRKWDSYDETDW